MDKEKIKEMRQAIKSGDLNLEKELIAVNDKINVLQSYSLGTAYYDYNTGRTDCSEYFGHYEYKF